VFFDNRVYASSQIIVNHSANSYFVMAIIRQSFRVNRRKRNTTKTFSKILERLAKRSIISDSESVKEAFVNRDIKENTRVLYCDACEKFLESKNLTWKRPAYKHQETTLGFLPTELEIDQLVAGAGKKMGTMVLL
jgi:hypothetical protein